MRTLRLILGDQLNIRHSWYKQLDPNVLYVMMEVRSETDYVRHHAQKVLGIFAAMRRFADALQSAGHQVLYLKICDQQNRQSLSENLKHIISDKQITRFERQQADEFRVEETLEQLASTLSIPVEIVDSEHFLCNREELKEKFAHKIPRMEFFYREQRKHWQILLDAQQKPLGGKWNFDAENRKKWVGTPKAPDWPIQAQNLQALWDEICSAGVKTMGNPSANAFTWPTGRQQAKVWLQYFIQHALVTFGDYQDAMSTESRTLFHSGLSFALNTKLLHPLEVIQAVVDAYEKQLAPLAAVEGFVRQILGWREYIRGVYWARMPGYQTLNGLEHHRPLPSWYWSGKTKMNCLRHAITQSLETGYAHHIQRLMLTGNFALLAGCHPDEVDHWYLGIYIDAFQWVELPNTRGMSQFADLGLIASKPYTGSASYIHRMSNYCDECSYSYKEKIGDKSCPFNSLYWNFHVLHESKLKNNPRLAMVYKNWQRFDSAEQEAITQQANHHLSNLNSI
ncbi:cryptochrome/photolyase family protein [Leeia sp. TBRC 13508]|uniref:Cryptochrome/photolyase family protein n=1 Tax=Leeia speluncae TaxID=2884804 RepID=A0ABS8D949_9NEIS|nr:cryptochrome/photolyase family protein [Leeia speluncae]MCB6184705.1 cryptochrome/photolyase family protein [Leeia speluncae]